MPDPSTKSSGVRLAELMAALSTATDLGMGQPMEYAMTSCIVAVRLGEAAGLTEDELRDVYYEALLRYIGCNADTYWMASLFGDELAFRRDFASVDGGDSLRVMSMALRYMRDANAGNSLLQTLQAMVNGLAQMPQVTSSFFPGHCEVAARLATRLGFPATFVRAAGQLYARWDGKGTPALKGEEIAPAFLVAALAQDVVIFFRIGGADAAVNMARERSGGAHAPKLVEVFCRHAPQILNGLAEEPVWATVLAMEPGQQRVLTQNEFDNACLAIADFGDIKSPYFLNHSPRVAEVASATAARCALPASDVALIRRAALLHDIGKVGISAGLWGKSGALTDREWEKVRLHPYYTERILARPAALAPICALAALHHERLDGSGYHRNLNAAMLSPSARVLATANHFCALTEERPHRPACTPEMAADELKRQVKAGRMDGEIVNGLLAATGQGKPSTRKETVAGLSEREVEVLRLLARGQTMKQVAEQLIISYKTVDRHVQNIYTKIGVSTRAGATLFVMEHQLLD
ncbi:MAG: HD domain-containing protein [Caldilineaceae bacterium]|nr:HD domain-containing protein [Caldilineaceae bacterium]HRW47542.1 HD domain-containing phosphohydrolase [Caldilinea sp.]